MNNLQALWILNRIHNITFPKFESLQNRLGDFSKLNDPEVRQGLIDDPDWGYEFLTQWDALVSDGVYERECERMAQAGVQMTALTEPEYPKLLAHIYHPPVFLYWKGTLVQEDEISLAIVGTRHPSNYGLRIAGRLSEELSAQGVTIVSGMASGIDGEAHKAAIRAGGRTLAVLGSGIDVIYPKEHVRLYHQISEHGAVISEYPMGTTAEPYRFPQRNRIIAGLTHGTLVIEAAHKSGSLITASLALEEGRQVYAVPGPVDSPASIGTNELIQQGAKLVTKADDILQDLVPQIRNLCHVERSEASQDPSQPVVAKDDKILNLLVKKPLHMDEIIAGVGHSPLEVSARLTHLELEGVVGRTQDGRYSRT